MQECMSQYPTLYPADDDDDLDEEAEGEEDSGKKAMAALESSVSKTATSAVSEKRSEPNQQEKQVVSQWSQTSNVQQTM